MAGGADVVRAPANLLQVVLEGWTEPGSELGEGGAVGTGEGLLLLGDGGVGLLEDAVNWAGGDGLCHSGGVKGLNGGLV